MQRTGPQSGDFRMIVDYVALPLLGTYSPRGARRRASGMLKASRRRGLRWRAMGELDRWGAHARCFGACARARAELLVADDPTANLNVLQREDVVESAAMGSRRGGSWHPDHSARYAGYGLRRPGLARSAMAG